MVEDDKSTLFSLLTHKKLTFVIGEVIHQCIITTTIDDEMIDKGILYILISTRILRLSLKNPSRFAQLFE